MGLKVGIVIPLSLIVCSMLVGDVKTKAVSDREARGVQDAVKEDKPFFRVVNDALELMSGMENLVHLIQDGKSREEFHENAMKKFVNVDKIIKKVVSVSILNGQLWKKIKLINDKIDQDFDKVWESLRIYLYHHDKVYDFAIKDDDVQSLIASLRNISVVTKYVVKNEVDVPVPQNIFESNIEIYNIKLSGPLVCNEISRLDETHNLFKILLAIVSKGYTMLLLSEQYRKMTSKNTALVQKNQETILQLYKDNVKNLTESAKFYIGNAKDITSRATFSCDPEQWKEGENYFRLKNYVTKQSDQSNWENREPDHVSPEHDCQHGFARRPIDRTPDLISMPCVTAFHPKQKGLTFTEFVGYSESIPNYTKCNLQVDTMLNQLCDEDKNSDPVLSVRRVSLRQQSCRTDKNEVMTSARLHEAKGLVRIEAQCGTIADGEIDPKSLRWNTIDRSYGSRDIENALLTWDFKSFNLDDIVVPDDELLTGVKFGVVDGHFISLVVQGSKVYNYTKGTKIGESNWHHPVQSSEKPRESIDISYLISPIKLTEQTEEMSEAGRNYINLTVSEWSDEYYNEAIVPFFDMTSHSATPVAPLAGLGLFYKSSPGYAGFLALKHITPKHIHFVNVDENFVSTKDLLDTLDM